MAVWYRSQTCLCCVPAVLV